MRPERPPEEWLLKAWNGDVLVDLIHRAVGLPVTDEVLARADELSVFSLRMRVLSLEDVITSKLMALNEHELDYEPVLTIVRAVREQVDWQDVRARTSDSPYSRAFFALLAELGLDTEHRPQGKPTHGIGARGRIRVLPS
jgi:hypothetical protein